MDIDRGLVFSILNALDKRAAFKAALEAGINAESLQGVGMLVWQLAAEHNKQFGDFPPLFLVKEKLGVEFEPAEFSGLTLEFFIKEIQTRRLFNILKDGYEHGLGLLEQGKPDECFAASQSMIKNVLEQRAHTSRVTSMFAASGQVLELYDKIKSGERGILSMWPTLDRWCVVGDSVVCNPVDGSLLTVREFVEQKLSKTLSFDNNKGIIAGEVLWSGTTGTKKCIKIKLGLGREIEGTPEHPLLTPQGWRRLDQIKEGDSIATLGLCPEPINIKTIPDHHVDLIALLLSEGYYAGPHASISNTDPAIVKVIKDIASKENCVLADKGVNAFYFTQNGQQNKNRKRDNKGRFNVERVHPFQKLLDLYGMKRVVGSEKEIPKIIFGLNNRQLACFIGTYWSGDGWVSILNRRNDVKELTIRVASISKKMMLQMQHLLLRLGIIASLITRKLADGRRHDQYWLIVRKESYDNFRKYIPLIGKRRSLTLKHVGNIGFSRLGHSLDIGDNIKARLYDKYLATKHTDKMYDKSLLKRARSMMRRQVLTFDGFFIRRMVNGKKCPSSWIPKTALRVLLELLHEIDLMWMVGDDIYWDTVSNVKGGSKQEVFDLTIKDTHNFIVNDIVAHNTLGWWPEDLYVVCARLKTGKTQALILIARAAWKNKKRVLFVSTEMSTVKVVQRFVAVEIGLPYNKFREATLAALTESKMREGILRLQKEQGLYIVGGDFDVNIENLDAVIDENKPDLLCVDGLYLVKAGGRDRYETVSAAVEELKRLAKRKSIPIVCTHQLNRSVGRNANKVYADQLAMSDVVGWTPDGIIGMLQNEDMRADKLMRIIPLALREGEGRHFDVHWDWDTPNFDEVGAPGEEYHDDEYDAAADTRAGTDEIPF